MLRQVMILAALLSALACTQMTGFSEEDTARAQNASPTRVAAAMNPARPTPEPLEPTDCAGKTTCNTNRPDNAPDIGVFEFGEKTYLPLVVAQISTPNATTMPLSQVRFWVYQIQDISAAGAVDALANSTYDVLVIDPTRTDWSSDDKSFDTKGAVAKLKESLASDGSHRKWVIAYIDIGEAENWRWYWTWSRDWDCQGSPPADWPATILACDPDGWGGNYPVAYWDPAWKDIVIYGQQTGAHPDREYRSIIDEVIGDGFDGIYLDWVEGFENDTVVKAAQAAGKDPALEMIRFIQEMRAYVAARQPGFVIIQQNAAALADGHPELFSVIDAIAQEAIWYDGDATDDWDDPDGYDWVNEQALSTYYLSRLQPYRDAGLPVLVCEYAVQHAQRAYTNAYSQGYIPYVTRRSLSKLTTTPPPALLADTGP